MPVDAYNMSVHRFMAVLVHSLHGECIKFMCLLKLRTCD